MTKAPSCYNLERGEQNIPSRADLWIASFVTIRTLPRNSAVRYIIIACAFEMIYQREIQDGDRKPGHLLVSTMLHIKIKSTRTELIKKLLHTINHCDENTNTRYIYSTLTSTCSSHKFITACVIVRHLNQWSSMECW